MSVSLPQAVFFATGNVDTLLKQLPTSSNQVRPSFADTLLHPLYGKQPRYRRRFYTSRGLATPEMLWGELSEQRSYPSSYTMSTDRWIHKYKPSYPLLILLGHSRARICSDAYGFEIESLPWGFCLDLRRTPSEPCPYEADSHLVLLALLGDAPLRRQAQKHTRRCHANEWSRKFDSQTTNPQTRSGFARHQSP